MKKILLFLLFPFLLLAQNPTNFPYGIKNTSSTSDSSPAYFITSQTDGVHKKTPAATIAKTAELLKKQFLSTGLIKNGSLSINADNTKFNLSAGEAVYSNFSDPDNIVSIKFSFPAFTAVTPAYLTTSNITYIAINYNNGTPIIVQQATDWTNAQKRDWVIIGAVVHSNFANINTINNISSPSNDIGGSLADVAAVFGNLNLEGNVILANGANLQLNKSAGEIFKYGANFHLNSKNPHTVSLPSQTQATIRYRLQGGFEGTDRINIDPDNYDNNNVLTTVSNSTPFTIQTIFISQTGFIRLQYGQNQYNSLDAARADINTRNFNVESNLKKQFVKIAYLIVKKGTTSLSDAIVSGDAEIKLATKYDATASTGTALTLRAIIDALGYTPENIANKSNSFTASSTTTYPNTKALVDGLDIKLNNLYVNNGYVAQNSTSPLTSSVYEGFPLMFRGQSNKMFVFYRQGADHATSKGVIQMRTSNDGGGNWSTASTIISDPTYDCRNISGGVAPNGRLILFYMRYIYGSALSFDQGYVYSDDEGLTWSNYTVVPHGTHTFYSPYGNLISIGNGKIMANWYGETPSSPTYSTYVIVSSDNGLTWSSEILVATSTTIRYGESSYAYLDGGIIVGHVRNSVGSPLYQFKSVDNGVTWTAQGQTTVDTGAQVSPDLITYIDSNNNKYIASFYANRGDNKIKVSIADYATAIAGVSGWAKSDIDTHSSTDFGYPTVVKSRENNKFLIAYYKAASTTLASIYFKNYTPNYGNIATTGTISATGNISSNTNISAVETVSGKDLTSTNFLTIKGTVSAFPTVGNGLEAYNSTSSQTIIQSYNRTGANYNEVNTRGSLLTWNVGAVEKMRLHASGGLSLGNFIDPGAGNLSITGNIISPTLTGTPTAPTAIAGTNTTQIATTAFVQTAIGNYKKYVALLTQTGTSAPTATVLENTLGGTVVWTRSGIGSYQATLTGSAYTSSKTVVFATIGLNKNLVINGARVSDSVVSIMAGTGELDSTNMSIEIRVYN